MRYVLRSVEKGGLGFKNEKVLLMGRSVGGGPATLLARYFNPRALVLISTFTSIKGVAKTLISPMTMCLITGHFNNALNVSRLKCPLLIVHGTHDGLISYEHAIVLRNAHKATG